MAKTKYIIELSEAEKEMLDKIIEDKKESERSVLRAKILLEFDISNSEKFSIPKLAEKLGTTHTTVQTVRTAYANGGIEEAVYRKKRTVEAINRRINPEITAQILQLAASEPPEGFKRWSLRLLCKESVSRGIVTKIGPTTMHKIINEGTTSILENGTGE